jgi:hypothetical protein
VGGLAIGAAAGALLGLVHAGVSIHLRADQVVSGTGINILALGVTGYVFIYHYGTQGTPPDVSRVPDVTLPGIEDVPFVGDAIGHANLMTWAALILVPLLTLFLFRTRGGLRLRSVGEKPRAADTVGLPVIRTRYLAVVASGALAAIGGAYLSIALLGSFNENMTAGRGLHRARGGDLRRMAARGARSPARSCSASRRRSPSGCRPSPSPRPCYSSAAICLDPGRGGRRHRPIPTARRIGVPYVKE